jgi:ADP-ribose pyrophosphatase
MTTVRFYENVEEEWLKFVVIVSSYKGQWVFCKHRQRNTYEVPGGHREPGEDILAAAKRELYEETGATEYSIYPICIYSVENSSTVEEGKAKKEKIEEGKAEKRKLEEGRTGEEKTEEEKMEERKTEERRTEGKEEETFGMLYYAQIREFGVLPEMEIEKIMLFSEVPEELTYPQIQPKLMEKVLENFVLH